MIEIEYNRKFAKNSGLKEEADFAYRKMEKFLTEGRIPESDIEKVIITPVFVGGQKRVHVIIKFNKESTTWLQTKEYIEMFFASRSTKIDVVDFDEK